MLNFNLLNWSPNWINNVQITLFSYSFDGIKSYRSGEKAMRLKYRRHYKTHFDSCLNDLYNIHSIYKMALPYAVGFFMRFISYVISIYFMRWYFFVYMTRC